MIQRKALIKGGRRLTTAGLLLPSTLLHKLVYYSPMTLAKSSVRKNYKSDPCKCQLMSGSFVMIPSPMIDTNSFQLTDDSVLKDVYKFRAPSADVAQVWITSLQEGILKHKLPKTTKTRKTKLPLKILKENFSSAIVKKCIRNEALDHIQ